MDRLFKRPVEVYNEGGAISVFRSSKRFLRNRIEDGWLWCRYKVKYRGVSPRPNERLWVDPSELDYTISSKHISGENEDYPNYGVVGGTWDLNKNYWRDSRIWGGLVERFEEGKPWEETSYYQSTVESLESGGPLGYLDGPKTRENFERYLDYLDELFRDMKRNGYDPSSVITVHVGREGDWMVGHGNHRRTLATIAGIDSVPVRIKYRHRIWQTIRQQYYSASSLEDVSGLEEYRQHPDTPDLDAD